MSADDLWIWLPLLERESAGKIRATYSGRGDSWASFGRDIFLLGAGHRFRLGYFFSGSSFGFCLQIEVTVRKIDRNFHILNEKSKFTFGIQGCYMSGKSGKSQGK